MNKRNEPNATITGRGYKVDDWPLTLGLGLSSALSAIVVLLLFIVNGIGQYSHYNNPSWLYVTPVMIWLWVLRIWLLSHRGELNEDPIVFALKDRVSYVLGLVAAIAFALAV
jgi:4-hydroxybenzoate polyprenyltransferase